VEVDKEIPLNRQKSLIKTLKEPTNLRIFVVSLLSVCAKNYRQHRHGIGSSLLCFRQSWVSFFRQQSETTLDPVYQLKHVFRVIMPVSGCTYHLLERTESCRNSLTRKCHLDLKEVQSQCNRHSKSEA